VTLAKSSRRSLFLGQLQFSSLFHGRRRTEPECPRLRPSVLLLILLRADAGAKASAPI
jgi:hypothetical protein